MRTLTLFSALWLLLAAMPQHMQAQGRANDIPVTELPRDVRGVLDSYVRLLRSSADLDACAEGFRALAGGSLVNEDGLTLRNSVAPFSLKKDFTNVQHYADPIRITRVNLGYSNGSGYGPSAIKGKVYKIWIDKKDPSLGMPAPITIMVPEGHPTIQNPKVTGIGSL